MRRAEIIGIILGIISILLAIPGFLLVFTTGGMAAGILTLLLAIGVLGVAAYIYIRDRQPPFTVTKSENVLTIKDADGRLAKFSGTRTIRAKQHAQPEYWIGGIAADGSVRNILIDGGQPDARREAGGEILVCKRYAPPLHRNEEDTLELTMDYVDSFMDPDKEVFGLRVGTVTRAFTLTIEFEGKPCNEERVSAYMSHFGTISMRRVPKPVVSKGGRRAELVVRRPREGATYTLEWRW